MSDSANSFAAQPRLTRLAVLPAAFMAGISTAVTGTLLRLQEGTADAATWGVLAGGAVLGCGCLAGAVLAARKRARSEAKRAESLRQAITSGNWALDEDLTRLKRGEQLLSRGFTYQASRGEDPYQKLEYDVTEAQHRAREALVWAASYFQAASDDNSDKVEVFVNLARRLQSLVHRTIRELDDLENQVEDPDLLRRIFGIDHLATRIRRHAENLAVLGGAVSRRQWTNPVTLTEVLRSSIAEVEQYSRVKLVPPIEGTLRGHAVADVIHLLAELVENATMFSHPDTQILLRSRRVTAGIAIEVEDRGLGIPQEDQDRINTLLADPARIDVAKLLADGRIGLFVVSSLARRHGIAVQLQGNIYGGVQAILVLPQGLLGDEEGQAPVQARPPAAPRPAQTPAPSWQPSPHAAPPAAAPPPAHAAPPVRTASPAGPPPGAPQRPVAPVPPPAAARHERPQPLADVRSEYRTSGYERPAPAPHGSGGSGRPNLPKRRAMEHLAPELRQGPAPRPDTTEQELNFSPGLLAGINRGFGLAGATSDAIPVDDARWAPPQPQGEEPHHGER
ncbi:ATP-binding protein [Streptomyces caniscabiei]|uniref:histidine kinase n=1 Tax=Streptomyces caniscabiei TaxID=2746961 RepID=A0ABU4MNF4_9ACTN|nr:MULTISPECIES: ATP-binding protein [Streptomyces]MDX2941758.1 ATP-binding protein [Streptomyces caniscabiei]MDX2951863.1 ATP-binding protein [Streptomyces caniscabiei]MDX2985978.1 ATP-binding protein [Streptomyces caniscabiei]MDX3012119.1 ATP-binding protein [Streptomyces caniscabiei]MDX3038676.1 ATP-binding protein [Streptomyces caniscabiei]